MNKRHIFILSIVFLLPIGLLAAPTGNKVYPFEINWPDRRPIASLWLSTSATGWPHNPRGWFQDKNLDITTTAGRAEFHKRLIKYADVSIANCKDLNAQGVIIWDIEGQEMPHMTSYIADPRMLSQVAPEMEPFADEFFKKFKKAGLKVGVALRPSRVVPNGSGGWKQQDVPNYIAEIHDKIQYAQRRWGCTLFYIDSNADMIYDEHHKIVGIKPMPADGFIQLARAHRDCLLMPEHASTEYWADMAPYHELPAPHNFTSTPPEVRAVYPHSFTVLRVVDGPPLEGDVFNKLVAGVKSGDILLFRGWWNDPASDKVKEIYEAAKK